MCDSRQPDDGAGASVVVNDRCTVCGASLPESRVVRAAHEDPSHRHSVVVIPDEPHPCPGCGSMIVAGAQYCDDGRCMGSAASELVFEARPHGREVSCSICGAVVADWAKSGDDFTNARPNQDRHRRWHESISGAEPYVPRGPFMARPDDRRAL